MNKRLVFLLSIPILGFMIFLVIHFSFLKIIHKAQQETENLRVKQIISSDINYEIIKIKSLFYQVVLVSSNKRSLNFNIQLVKKELQKTKHLLEILKNGGVYKKVVELNVVGKSYFEETYKFKKNNESLEVIDLLPKIEFLEKKVLELDNILKHGYITKNKLTASEIKKRRRNIIKFSRGLDSVFRRMIENSNRLFYESQMKLISLEKKVKDKILFYQNIEFSLIIFLILSFIIIGYMVVKELIYLNKELSKKLYIDELTKVYTRAKLEEKEFGENSVLILVDIDDFSSINELYGMENGNKVLQIIANKLKTFNKKWEVFKVSADVFALYMDDYTQINKSIEEKIYDIQQHIMYESIVIDEYQIDINVTLGIGFSKNALHDAFAALNLAKDEKIAYMIFSDEEQIKKQTEYNLYWQKEIKYALASSRIEPFFQSIVDKDKKVIKYECLMRMKKEENGEIKYIPPFFLDVAIKTKQYLSLSREMIEKTFIRFKDGGEFSINLNYMDMKDKFTKELIETLIKEYNAQDRVTFEILESESIQDYNIIIEFIKYFRQFGVKIAIDDFGSGYSNLQRIMELKPDFIKFDGSLIKNIDKDSNAYIIVKHMIGYARELKIKTIAEFVHNKEVFDTCVYLGIDYFQGYYVGKPKKEIKD